MRNDGWYEDEMMGVDVTMRVVVSTTMALAVSTNVCTNVSVGWCGDECGCVVTTTGVCVCKDKRGSCATVGTNASKKNSGNG